MRDAKAMVDFLNECLVADPQWVKALVEFRPTCNETILNHPSIQCLGPDEGGPGAGLIGFLNGFYGSGFGPIAVELDDKTLEIQGFKIVSKDPIEDIKEVRWLGIKPDDVLIVSTDKKISHQGMDNLYRSIHRVFPNNKAVILDDGIRLDIVSPDQIKEPEPKDT